MSKAILLMDMPESCEKCRLHSFFGKDMDVICKIKGLTQSYEVAYKGKPDWCPLRELSQKKDRGKVVGDYLRGRCDGYNACIDEILKEGAE